MSRTLCDLVSESENTDRDLRERWELSSLCKGVEEEMEFRGTKGCCGGREGDLLICRKCTR